MKTEIELLKSLRKLRHLCDGKYCKIGGLSLGRFGVLAGHKREVEAGYTQVRDVKSTAEGIVAKAMRYGKEVSLVVDSSGKFRDR